MNCYKCKEKFTQYNKTQSLCNKCYTLMFHKKFTPLDEQLIAKKQNRRKKYKYKDKIIYSKCTRCDIKSTTEFCSRCTDELMI